MANKNIRRNQFPEVTEPSKKGTSKFRLQLRFEKEILLLEKLVIKNISSFDEEMENIKNDSEKEIILSKYIKLEKNTFSKFSKEVKEKFVETFNPKYNLEKNKIFKEAIYINKIIKLSNKILEQNQINQNKDKTISNLSEVLNKNSKNIDEQINSKLDKINTKLNEDISTTNLKQIYNENKNKFEDWIFNGKKLKNSNQKTKQEHIRKTKRIFENEIKTVYDFNKLRDNSSEVFFIKTKC